MNASVPAPQGNIANDTCGWASDLPHFRAATVDDIVGMLMSAIRDATPEQEQAWRASIPPLQRECEQLLSASESEIRYCAILEYRMPDGAKRVDAILLLPGTVLVIEMKGDGHWQPEYREQAADYARRLFWYHREIWERGIKVRTLLVSYGADELEPDQERDFLTSTHVSRLAPLIQKFDRFGSGKTVPLDRFIAPGVCQPSPSLVQAARSYFSRHELPRLKRIDDVTGKTLARVLTEVRTTHAAKRRKLVLVSGVPGAGKTYVGLQIAHEPSLDDLAELDALGNKPTSPAVFLSGNGPLVAVLQYELRGAGGEGRVFVRGVKEFVKRYTSKASGSPPHHVLIFDEAQRAWDATHMERKHKESGARSEPESFISFAERIPGWCVVLGLIGSGQEIHTGEEGGIALWAEAIATRAADWDVVGPAAFSPVFEAKDIRYFSAEDLHLAQSVRFHFAAGLSEWAAGLVEDQPDVLGLARLAAKLREQGYQLRITRDLRIAQEFLWKKHEHLPDARYGIVTSSRDKSIGDVITPPVASKFFRAGPWYSDPPSSPSSCCRLQEPITEFAAQGLELDHTLLIWGTDFVRTTSGWDNSAARQYRKGTVENPLQLRRNAYRVLLTRGREGILIVIPAFRPELDATYEFLLGAGCQTIDGVEGWLSKTKP